MLLEEICRLLAIIWEQVVEEYKLHVVDASLSDDWFLYHFDQNYKTYLSKFPETNPKNDDVCCYDCENNFKL